MGNNDDRARTPASAKGRRSSRATPSISSAEPRGGRRRRGGTQSAQEIYERDVLPRLIAGAEDPAVMTARAMEVTKERRKHLLAAGVPDLFADVNLLSLPRHYPPLHHAAAGRLIKVVSDRSLGAKGGPTIALLGDVGVGKTALGCGALGHAHDLATTRTAKLLYAPALVYLQKLMAGSRERQERAFQDFATAEVVVIDDLNRRGESTWARDQVELLVDARHGGRRPTILLSNLDVDPFVDDIGRPMHRRIVETGGIVRCNWPRLNSLPEPGSGGAA